MAGQFLLEYKVGSGEYRTSGDITQYTPSSSSYATYATINVRVPTEYIGNCIITGVQMTFDSRSGSKMTLRQIQYTEDPADAEILFDHFNATYKNENHGFQLFLRAAAGATSTYTNVKFTATYELAKEYYTYTLDSGSEIIFALDYENQNFITGKSNSAKVYVDINSKSTGELIQLSSVRLILPDYYNHIFGDFYSLSGYVASSNKRSIISSNIEDFDFTWHDAFSRKGNVSLCVFVSENGDVGSAVYDTDIIAIKSVAPPQISNVSISSGTDRNGLNVLTNYGCLIGGENARYDANIVATFTADAEVSAYPLYIYCVFTNKDDPSIVYQYTDTIISHSSVLTNFETGNHFRDILTNGTYEITLSVEDTYGVVSSLYTISEEYKVSVHHNPVIRTELESTSRIVRFLIDEAYEPARYVISDDGSYIAPQLLVHIDKITNIGFTQGNAWTITGTAISSDLTETHTLYIVLPSDFTSRGYDDTDIEISRRSIGNAAFDMFHEQIGGTTEHPMALLNPALKYTINLKIQDNFSAPNINYVFNIGKSGAIFNIEQYGVGVGLRAQGNSLEPRFTSGWNTYIGTPDDKKSLYVGDVNNPSSFGLFDINGNPWFNTSDSGWINIPFATGSANYGDGDDFQVRKIGNICFVKGEIKKTSTTVASNAWWDIGTLPEGYRPAYFVMGAAGDVDGLLFYISKSGLVRIYNRSGATINLNVRTHVYATYPAEALP